MSEDLTQKLPGDKEPTTPDDDRIGLLIIAVQSLNGTVQSLSESVHSLSTAVQEIKERLEALETTVATRLLETKPIWERALAEIAETRAEMKDGFRRLSLRIELLHEDSMTLREDQRLLERRVDALESKTP